MKVTEDNEIENFEFPDTEIPHVRYTILFV